jgi:hypothetical protein
MWVKAVDIVLEKLRLEGVRFEQIVGISGAGQVLYNSSIISLEAQRAYNI